jgi:small conductance mechanosensitive channel
MNMVTNHHRGSSRLWVEITIPYEFRLDKALEVLDQVCNELNAEHEAVLRDKLWVMGVGGLTPNGALVRLMGTSEPMQHWALERAARKKAIEKLAAAGMAAPYAVNRVFMETPATTAAVPGKAP